jgi:hypothetical protein
VSTGCNQATERAALDDDLTDADILQPCEARVRVKVAEQHLLIL